MSGTDGQYCEPCNESRETAWILALSLTFAILAQLHLHEPLPMLAHFFNAQIPALGEAVHHALSPITDLLPLARLGGLL